MRSCIDISMPLLSESYLLMSSFSRETNLSVSIFLYVLGVRHPSFIPALLFPSHHSAFVSLFFPYYLIS